MPCRPQRKIFGFVQELLATVARGEEVIITYRGKPVAKLVPLESREKQASADLDLYGIWANHQSSQNVRTYIRQMRKPKYSRVD